MDVSPTETSNRWQKFFLAACAILLILRALTVVFTTLEIGPDEAQYWRWSTEFDWGYYSKPPMIAWIIGFETFLLGHSEWAIRVLSPVFHLIVAIALCDIGRRHWNMKAGVLAGLLYFTIPGVWLSSVIMTTDAPLMACWATSLALLFRLREKSAPITALGLGLAIGLGFLSKYAMVYFPIGMALACVFDQKLRRALISVPGAITLGTALLVMLPHILWSVATGFKTVGHTADNANWGGDVFNPENGIKFFVDQFGVFGPVAFGIFLAFIIAFLAGKTSLRADRKIRVLLAFALPPLIVILVQAFISRAHANWGATAFPAAAVIVGVWVSQGKRLLNWAMATSFVINVTAGVIFAFVVMAPAPIVNDLGLANAFKRLRGWPETTRQIADYAAEMNATAIITDEREIWHGLDYYGRDGVIDIPLRAWRRASVPQSFSEEIVISETDAQNALLVNYRSTDLEKEALDFEGFELLKEIRIDLGGGKERVLRLYQVKGLKPAYAEKNQ